MPLYEYSCRECGHRFEVLQRMGEGGERLTCPRCATPAPERRMSTFAGITGGASSRGESFAGCGSPACGTGFS